MISELKWSFDDREGVGPVRVQATGGAARSRERTQTEAHFLRVYRFYPTLNEVFGQENDKSIRARRGYQRPFFVKRTQAAGVQGRQRAGTGAQECASGDGGRPQSAARWTKVYSSRADSCCAPCAPAVRST
ncbi:hypothetical protein PR002_g17188 [Phytophthora rubi]|uniref:Uncharacterized protein n=1 Tax=Phytophthora rubi TaxID=129364 RepID=A0A6A3K8K1_9STRA|nr:hypothetical protein PR002_g17188 [Phytophthora rubi]